ncbi:MAG: molybdenum ABC transporter ATP-binding protein [Methylophilaceae bacterium]
MIEINIHFHRKNFTLDANLNLPARVTGLFGPSGSGKSTLLSILAGLIKPDAGRLMVDGECLFDSQANINIPIHHRRIGLVFQEGRLFPHFTVQHNLTYGLSLLEAQQQRFGFNQIVALLEIGHLLKQRPHQLSGGEKQRVAIGRALLSSPRLLLLDEPLASLDERLKNQILPFLKKMAEEIDIPMIYISHSLDEIQQITENIAFIDQGKICGYH